MKTRFTELVGCTLPLQLAVLGGAGTAELAEAVAAAGGLGMAPAGVEFSATAHGAIGVGFLMPFAPALDVVAEVAQHVRVVEFFYGEPSAEYVRVAHGAGALCSWQTGSVAEALAAEQAGCDFVVAQGTEAGGHVRGVMRRDDLLVGVLAAVTIPVVAAGGIATAAAVASVLALGADAVRIGTAYVASEESAAHPAYKAALVAAAGPEDTVLTTHFDEEWPAAPHRVLRTALSRAELSGNRSINPPSSYEPGDTSDMAMYAGEGVGAVHAVRDARAITSDLFGAIS